MSPYRMGKIEAALRAVLDFYTAVNRQDVAAAVQLLSGDCVMEDAAPPPGGAVTRGQEAAAAYWEAFFRQNPQARFEIEDIYNMGRHCAAAWKLQGLGGERGESTLRGLDLFHVQRGKIIKRMTYIKGSWPAD